MIVFKCISYIIYGFCVIIFMYYVNISYIYHFYKDWILCDYVNKSNFDYIVVGAGSAGSILTKRLLNAGAKVLLIEAGGPPIYFFDIPVITPLLLNTEYDWKYMTVPQKYACKALKYNQSIWSSGKILGGSSRLNNMIYVEGHSNDYNFWFPDFKKPIVENGGFLHVDNQNWHSPLSDVILKGIDEISDSLRKMNNISKDFMKARLTMKDGERWSTDRVIHQHKKLKILTNSLVSKILFKLKKAVGVKLLRGNKMYQAFASRGVIICAGAIGTPKLLMLSGIGPMHHLQEHNIKVIADLPVGQNLMDHIITGFDLVTLNSNFALSITDVLNPYSIIEYYAFGKGPWTSSGVDIIGTLYSKFEKNTSSKPDLQIMVFPTGLSQDNGIALRKNLGISNNIFNEYFAPLTYRTAITIAPILLHPKSKGEIKLKSSNPLDAPIIDPKYLSNEEDVLKLIDGIQFIKRLVQTKAMNKIGAQLYKKPFPGCENFLFDSIQYWRCYIKHLTLTTYHSGGTCKFGAVIDSKFRVYKMENLFVADASIFPELPSGNIHVPVVMLAEKAASLLVKDFKKYIERYKCYKSDIFLSINKCS